VVVLLRRVDTDGMGFCACSNASIEPRYNFLTGAPINFANPINPQINLRCVIEGAKINSQTVKEVKCSLSLSIKRCKKVVPLRGLPMIKTGLFISVLR